MTDILVLSGVNLNLLGTREPEVYGTQTLAELEAHLTSTAQKLGVDIDCFQSNAEHELVDRIHATHAEKVQIILINPGAFTHTSIALRDALLGVGIPFIEIHLSNLFARESFRHNSYLSDIALGVITGLGPSGYELALLWAAQRLQSKKAVPKNGS